MKKVLLVFVFLTALLLPLKAMAVQTKPKLHSNVNNPFYLIEGVSFSFQIETLETGSFKYELVDGNLPSGLTITEDGLVSGTVSSIDYDLADETGSNYALYNLEVIASDSSAEYSDTYLYLTIFIFEPDSPWQDFTKLKTDFEFSENMMAIGENGVAFIGGVRDYQALYNETYKTLNIIATQNTTISPGFSNYGIIALVFPYSETRNLLQQKVLENVGFYYIPLESLVPAHTCDLDDGLCIAYYRVGIDLDDESNTKHLYLKYYNPNDSTSYYKLNYSVIYYEDYYAMFETNSSNFVPTEDIIPGSKITKPTDPTKTGYTFEGWYSDEALTTAWDFDTIPEGNTTLYAKWAEAKTTSFITSDENNHFISETPLSSLYIFHVDNITDTIENIDTINASLENKEVVRVMDIYLKDDSNNIVEVSSGNYEVKIKLTGDLLNYTNYKVGYLNPDTNLISEWFTTTIEDGYLIFNTTHLSEYVIVGNAVSNPSTLDNIYEYIIYTTLSAICLTTALIILKKRNKNHK